MLNIKKCQTWKSKLHCHQHITECGNCEQFAKKKKKRLINIENSNRPKDACP